MSKWNQTMSGGEDIVYISSEDIIKRGKVLRGKPDRITMSVFDEETQQYSSEWGEKKATIRKMQYGGYIARIEGEEGVYALDRLFQTRKGGPWCHRLKFPLRHRDDR